jgi:hypothetical protein
MTTILFDTPSALSPQIKRVSVRISKLFWYERNILMNKLLDWVFSNGSRILNIDVCTRWHEIPEKLIEEFVFEIFKVLILHC